MIGFRIRTIGTLASTTLRVTRVSLNQCTTCRLFAFHSTVSFLIDGLLRSTKFPTYPEIPAVQSIVVDRRESSVTFALPKDVVAQRSELPRLSTNSPPIPIERPASASKNWTSQNLPPIISRPIGITTTRLENALTAPSLGTSRACNLVSSRGNQNFSDIESGI